MPGKNQTKRLKKDLEHVEMVWTREQMEAATFNKKLDDAAQTIEQYRSDLTDEEYLEVQAKLAEQREFIQATLLAARDKYVGKVNEIHAHLN